MQKLQVARLHSLTGHTDAVYTLQPSSQAHHFFSAAGDGMVVLWDQQQPEQGQLIARLPNSIYALHFHPGSEVLVAGHNYDGIHVLDWKNKNEIASLQLSKAAIFDIQSRGETVMVASGDGSLTSVDLTRMMVTQRVQATDKSARTIALNDTTGDIAVGYSDHFIRVFDAKLSLKREWKAHTNSVFTLRYTSDQKYLMSGSRDARLKVWDVQGSYHQAAEVVAHMYAINHLDFSPDGKHFVTCSMDKSIKVWDAEELKLLKVIDRARHAGHGTSVNKLLWTGYNNQLISASDDRTISLWQIIF
ncbi:WD40 repeat domain-containing protein [Fulvivirgaceae bacterium PWU4]|uniref:WD40 repeat domain-containing protein n=1 Tax=Chryseosolibacter histidini TaxID=2782349 RepID=A0AAP2DSY9_9BACT|nr:WD40 repeat domain-containing protein [Chryseosolibacter histidini]MBT1700753.1 WD40 repeat domain-containing protein [Chryseosolibacter histidini]